MVKLYRLIQPRLMKPSVPRKKYYVRILWKPPSDGSVWFVTRPAQYILQEGLYKFV